MKREKGEDKAKRYFQWQFTDSKINDPTHKGPELRSLLIRHPGPPPPPGCNPYESYRFQRPINERPWQTTMSLTPPPSLPALHLDNLILYHRKRRKKTCQRFWGAVIYGNVLVSGRASGVECVSNSAHVRWRRAIYEQSRGKWPGWRPLQHCCSYGNEK